MNYDDNNMKPLSDYIMEANRTINKELDFQGGIKVIIQTLHLKSMVFMWLLLVRNMMMFMNVIVFCT